MPKIDEIEIDIKIKDGASWRDMDVSEYREERFYELLNRIDGREARIRIKSPQLPLAYYIAGTPVLADRLRAQAKKNGIDARVFTTGEFYLEAKRLGLLGVMTAPTWECLPALFPGATIETISLFSEK